jgi:hypothetical protein
MWWRTKCKKSKKKSNWRQKYWFLEWDQNHIFLKNRKVKICIWSQNRNKNESEKCTPKKKLNWKNDWLPKREAWSTWLDKTTWSVGSTMATLSRERRRILYILYSSEQSITTNAAATVLTTTGPWPRLTVFKLMITRFLKGVLNRKLMIINISINITAYSSCNIFFFFLINSIN